MSVRRREGWGCSACALLAAIIGGCTSAAAAPMHVAAAPPPQDDGQASKGGVGGGDHAAALEQLKVSPAEWRTDRQNSVRLLLPDAEHWMRVKFWGLPSLAGFRYGKDHHAVVGAFVTHVPDASEPGACARSLEAMAAPWVRAFELEVTREGAEGVPGAARGPAVEAVFARQATLTSHDAYAVAYGSYPAWKGACLIVGVAVPARDDDERARDVRDRFAQSILPRVQVLGPEEPKERY